MKRTRLLESSRGAMFWICGCLANLTNSFEEELMGCLSAAAHHLCALTERKKKGNIWHFGISARRRRGKGQSTEKSSLQLWHHHYFTSPTAAPLPLSPERCRRRTWSSPPRCRPRSCQTLLSEPLSPGCRRPASRRCRQPLENKGSKVSGESARGRLEGGCGGAPT